MIWKFVYRHLPPSTTGLNGTDLSALDDNGHSRNACTLRHDIYHGLFNCECHPGIPISVNLRNHRRALIAINADGSTGLFFSTVDCHRWIAVQGTILQLIVTTVDVVLITRGPSFSVASQSSVSIAHFSNSQSTRCTTVISNSPAR